MITDHRPYIAAVEQALTEAGFEILYGHADDYDPRGGAIQIDTRSRVAADWFAGWTEVWLSWTEDRGWAVTVEEDNKVDRTFVVDVPVPRLASPMATVQAFAEKAGATVVLADDGFPDLDFPSHTFEDDDPAFEAALARYAEVAQ